MSILLLGVILAVALCFPVYAIPGWMKDAIESGAAIEPHEDASALYLLRSTDAELKESGESVQKIRMVVKILSSDGSLYGKVNEPLHPNRQIKNLKGWCLPASGSELKLSRDDMVSVASATTAGFYDDVRNLTAGFGYLKAGDIVGYEYEIHKQGSLSWSIIPFVFQDDQPVVHAECSVVLPEGWKMRAGGRIPSNVAVTQTAGTNSWRVFNLPYIPMEPYMPPLRLVLPHLFVVPYDPSDPSATSANDWRTVSASETRLLDSPVVVAPEIQALSNQLCSGLDTDGEKVAAIAAWVQKEIRYVAVAIGDGGICPRPAATTLGTRYGDCKDKTTLMRCLLAAADIRSQAVLARVEGDVIDSTPGTHQFDHVIVGLFPDESLLRMIPPYASVSDRVYFDPTDPSTPLGHLPVSLYGTGLLPVSEQDSALVWLPHLEPEDWPLEFRAVCTLDSTWGMDARITVLRRGRRAVAAASDYETTDAEETRKWYQESYAEQLIGPSVTDFARHTDSDSAWVTFRLQSPGPVQKVGDRLLLKANPFFSEDMVPLKRSARRYHHIYLGSQATERTEIKWVLPAGWKVAPMPDSVNREWKGALTSCRATSPGGTLVVEFENRYPGTIEPRDEYENACDFVRSMSSAARLQVFLERVGGDSGE
ncbi:MAG: DUF3857 and transglutaminase domain-containing protein [candidate division Zixibacteria bacterium]|nr:DUF3857 and transglutaminase domain-containing protein [candidate division Zixibacteria bacterium]